MGLQNASVSNGRRCLGLSRLPSTLSSKPLAAAWMARTCSFATSCAPAVVCANCTLKPHALVRAFRCCTPSSSQIAGPPVFGADIVAGRGVVSAAIVDLSPVDGTLPTAVLERLEALPKREFSQERELPEWGTIFSPYVRFVRPADAEEEQRFIDVVSDFLQVLADASRDATAQPIDHPDTVRRHRGQLSYCQQQKRNDKTRRVLEKAFNPEWADRYIEELLFDDPLPLQ